MMEVATLDNGKTNSDLGITSLQPQNSQKLKALWESLFDANAFSEQYEDKDLQSVALLTGTIFSIFRGLREKYEDAQKECKKLENNLKATLANLQATKKDLQNAKEAQCLQCTQLQKELFTHQEKLEQLKSIVPILNCNNGLQLQKEALTPQKRAQFICNFVHSILLGDAPSEHNQVETISKNCKSVKRNAKGEKILSRKNLFGVNGLKHNDDKILGATLAAESYPSDENIPPDFLGNNYAVGAVHTFHESPANNRKENRTGADSNVTPKKGMDSADATLQSSPVLCSSNKKHKSSHFELSQKDSPNELYCSRISDIVRNCSQVKTQKSPSLLNLDVLSSENSTEGLNKYSDKKHITEKAVMDDRQDTHNTKMSHGEKQQQLNEIKEKKPKTEVWELKPKPGLTKLKQTILSVAKATTTVDLSKTTFSGGIGVSFESNSLLNETNGNYDEETALATALQKSLKEIKKENNTETEAEEQEDIVNPSPTAEASKMFLRSNSVIRSRSKNLIKSKSNAVTMHCSQLDETLFAPAQTSTQNHEMLSEVQKEEAKEEPVGNILKYPERQFETSFDRVPQKPSTSPNFKYRRQAVRKQALRQKLEGWDCAQCKNYYGALGDSRNQNNLKDRMNRCSRHRDKYQFNFNTPPGFWDVDILSSQETVLESPQKNMQR